MPNKEIKNIYLTIVLNMLVFYPLGLDMEG